VTGKTILWLAAAAALTASAAAAETEEKIEARVNDRILTTTELQRRLAPLYSQYEESAPPSQLSTLKKMARNDAINGWIDEQLMLIAAESREDIQVDPLEVERDYRETMNRFPSEEDFLASLAEEGFDEDSFRKRLTERIKMSELVYREVNSRVNVTPREVMDYYRDHPQEFTTPEQIRISMILVPAPDDPAARAAARGRAVEAAEKIASGADFAEVVRDYSLGPAADSGGDMGYLSVSEMRSDLARGVEGIEVGGYSGIIEGPGSFQIVKVTGRKQASRKPLESVWQSISDQLYQTQRRQIQDRWLDSLRRAAYVLPAESGQSAP